MIDDTIVQQPGSNLVLTGIDLSEFYPSVEWDILEIPAGRNEEYYPCCSEPFADITFKMTMRRKTLFYTVNLIIPCVALTFLTVLVFYLPSDSGEKVTLCISILVSLTVFFLLLAEIIPPTSLAVPLLGKYLLFTMILVSLSVWTTVCVLNIHFRSPSTHRMSPLLRKLFLDYMAKLMCMRRTHYSLPDYDDNAPCQGIGGGGYANELDVRDSISHDFPNDFGKSSMGGVGVVGDNGIDDGQYDGGQMQSSSGECLICSIYRCQHRMKHIFQYVSYFVTLLLLTKKRIHHRCAAVTDSDNNLFPRQLSPEVMQALRGVRFIAQHIKDADKDNEVSARQLAIPL